MRKRKGFTMAELMVAMAVIGILVAIVTPAVMRNRPSRDKMMVKKTFYTAENIVSTLINDERLYPDKTENCYDEDEATECFWGFDDDSEVEGYEGITIQDGIAGAYKFSGLFMRKLNVKRQEDRIAYTNDGMKWDFSNANKTNGTYSFKGKTDFGDSEIPYILVDINGDKGPNCRQSDEGCSQDNFDTYAIQILATGKMRIDRADSKAAEYIEISTSLRD